MKPILQVIKALLKKLKRDVDESVKSVRNDVATVNYDIKTFKNNAFEIIDVLELPTSPNKDCIYRVTSNAYAIIHEKVDGSYGHFVNENHIVHLVETLPSEGDPYSDNGVYNYYYSLKSNTVEIFENGKWTKCERFNVVQKSSIGKLTSGKHYIVLNTKAYIYKSGWVMLDSSFISGGAGIRSTILNDNENNIASGDYSHAEGYYTTASGDYSHAEGSGTTASGYGSHAEGDNARAFGDYSHAEGYATTASGGYQHVQGKYNMADPDSKYAHIVGNGYTKSNHGFISSFYSNAHTLDWSGNGWFQGDIKLGGSSYDDETAVKVLTTKDLENLPTGGDSGPAIIDVVKLPTEDIQEDKFYRVLTASFLYGQDIKNDWTLYTVETLPETGEMCWNGTTAIAYYSVSDNNTYGYVDANVSAAMGVPVGWYPADVLIPAVGRPYGGIIYDIAQAAGGTVYTYLQNVVHSYKDGVWSKIDVTGWRGTGVSSEIFNHLSNTASGYSSHAEGYRTTASGDYGSHAEGHGTTASGDSSHAEGFYTTASGSYSHAEGGRTKASSDFSHAEGWSTTASGMYSHAEGTNAEASGWNSHAEGWCTTAIGDHQHTQGKANIDDPDSKYAHIVGNGSSSTNRSNAHTLDWNGLGWFAGGLKVGGTGQDDANAVSVLTEADIERIVEAVVARIQNG